MFDATPLCIDLQREFTSPEGKAFRERPSVRFVREVLVPELRARSIKAAEVVSDYRQPRHLDGGEYCVPGTPGFESSLPDDVKKRPAWVKAHNHPAWVRENGGAAGAPTGHPYCDSAAFGRWLREAVGPPPARVLLFGLTLDCCVLCVAQELHHRGYRVRVLAEATDTFSGDAGEKAALLRGPPLRNWAEPASWPPPPGAR